MGFYSPGLCTWALGVVINGGGGFSGTGAVGNVLSDGQGEVAWVLLTWVV